jgi:hypothetical protein
MHEDDPMFDLELRPAMDVFDPWPGIVYRYNYPGGGIFSRHTGKVGVRCKTIPTNKQVANVAASLRAVAAGRQRRL